MRHASVRPLLALAAAASLAAQTPAPGFAATARHTATGPSAGLLGACAAGDWLYTAWRNNVEARDAAGTVRFAHALPLGQWAGLVRAPAALAGTVLFTDFATRELFAHRAPAALATRIGKVPANTFDLAVDAATGAVLASANPLWPQPGAVPGVYMVDAASDRHREVVRLAGASGPLAWTAGGDLLYATQSATWPPPPGSTDLLRFDRARLAAAIAGGGVLTRADATTLLRGLPGAYALAVDGRDRVYATDPQTGDVLRTVPGGTALEPTPLLAAGTLSATHAQFVAGAGPAHFAAFQPVGGGELLVAVTDYGTQRSDVLAVAAHRPELDAGGSTVVRPGPGAIDLSGAPTGAAGALFVGPAPPVPEYRVATVAGLPLWWSLAPQAAWTALPFVADAAGSARVAFFHARGHSLQLTLQAACFAGGDRHGSSTVLVLTLLP